MIKEAMQFLLSQAKETEFHEKNGELYSNVNLSKIEEPTRSALTIQSLTGAVDFIKDNFDEDEKLIITVLNERTVYVETQLNDNKEREVVLRVTADVPEKTLNHHMPLEEFNIQLQSQFIETGDSEKILSIIGNLRNENVKNLGDDGITQVVEVKKGVTIAQDEVVPNPVYLKPFRSFTEISQPESPFVFRLKQRNDEVYAALFEADGGAWRNEARQSIKKFFDEKLHHEVLMGEVLIIG